MTGNTSVAVQGSLAPEVFSRFINLKVGMNLGGSASYDLEELEKILSGDPLAKGTELVITARYYIKDVRMPVERKEDYSVPYDQRAKAPSIYQLGGAKLELALIGIEKVESKTGRIKQKFAAPCGCLVPIEPNTEPPQGFKEAAYPLRGRWAAIGCEECHGKGYVFPRENKAPMAPRTYSSYGEVVVLVDEIPEPPDVPEGACETCGATRGHQHDCPVRAAEKAAAKKAIAEAKKAYKTETGKKAPDCYGSQYCYRGGDCEARKQCTELRSPKPEERPECFGMEQLSDECVDCEYSDACIDQAELNMEAKG